MSVRINFDEIPKKLMSSMMAVENYVNDSGFESKLLELIRFRVSQINECAYCIDMHYKEAIAAGEEPQRLYSVAAWKETPYYSDQEKSMLAWAESVSLPLLPSDQQALYNDLSRHITKQDIANFTLSVIQINSWNRLAKSFGFEAGHYQIGQH